MHNEDKNEDRVMDHEDSGVDQDSQVVVDHLEINSQ